MRVLPVALLLVICFGNFEASGQESKQSDDKAPLVLWHPYEALSLNEQKQLRQIQLETAKGKNNERCMKMIPNADYMKCYAKLTEPKSPTSADYLFIRTARLRRLGELQKRRGQSIAEVDFEFVDLITSFFEASRKKDFYINTIDPALVSAHNEEFQLLKQFHDERTGFVVKKFKTLSLDLLSKVRKQSRRQLSSLPKFSDKNINSLIWRIKKIRKIN